jgi:HSP20 family protein
MTRMLIPAIDPDFRPWRGFWSDWGFPANYFAECRDWEPATDIAETDGYFTITMELPGIDMTKTDISFNDGILTVKGEKHKEASEGECCHCSERYAGSFTRTLRVSDRVQRDKIDATYKDGVLKVTLPKSEETVTKKIEVH